MAEHEGDAPHVSGEAGLRLPDILSVLVVHHIFGHLVQFRIGAVGGRIPGHQPIGSLNPEFEETVDVHRLLSEIPGEVRKRSRIHRCSEIVEFADVCPLQSGIYVPECTRFHKIGHRSCENGLPRIAERPHEVLAERHPQLHFVQQVCRPVLL